MSNLPPLRTLPTLDFPDSVEGFLDPAVRKDWVGCLTALCSGPANTLQWMAKHDGDERESDQKCAQLIMSGLLQACMDAIETADNCVNRPANFSKALFRAACETNISWGIIMSFSDNDSSTSLVALAFLKIAIHTIRFFGRCGRKVDNETTVAATRLFWRTLSKFPMFDTIDEELLRAGAIAARWERAAEAARSECDSGRPMSHFVHPTALEWILETPSAQDRALVRWMLRHDVFEAIGGWVNSSACRRSSEVAAKAMSWRLLRELLLVGHKSSLDPTTSYDVETKLAVKKLMTAPMEQRDGRRTPMPRVYLVCAANGCNKPSDHVCTRCKTLAYCSKDCQKKHWKSIHKHECVTP